MADVVDSGRHLSELLALDVEWAPEQFLGCPWWAVWVLRSTDPEVSFYSLVRPDEQDTHGAMGIRLDIGGQQRVDRAPQLRRGLHSHEPEFRLEGGQVRRGLVDLSSILPTALFPGVYNVAISYCGKWYFRVVSSPVYQARLLAPPSDVWSYVAALTPMLQDEGSWIGVCERLVQRGVAPLLPPAHPLAWPMLLARANVDRSRLTALPAATFTGWPSALEPHVRLVYIEWLIANGDIARAKAEASELKTRAPGLEHAINRLELESSSG